jgi:D-glycero-D-manno-heptose 1,7-bisphosphate phosphatase
MMGRRWFVLLDRDGTIIVERYYLSGPAGVELLPVTAAGMKRLRELGLGLGVVTNESALGRGFCDLSRLEQIQERMRTLLGQEGVSIDGVSFCPHAPEASCGCRKPATGWITAACGA